MVLFSRKDIIRLAGVGAASALLPHASTASATSRINWRPDGTNQPRLGLLVAAHDWNPEVELTAMCQGQVNICTSRMPIQFNRKNLSEITHADAAADLLTRLNLGAVLYTSTSTSYFLGIEGEEVFKKRLEGRVQGVPLVMPAMALAEALKTSNLHRIALVHPPWFSEEQNELGRAYFRSQGFEVLSALAIKPARSFTEVSAKEVYRWVMENTPREAEAVVQGGGGLRFIGAIQALEKSLRRPVITANQATLWAGLKLAGARVSISGYGRMFAW